MEGDCLSVRSNGVQRMAVTNGMESCQRGMVPTGSYVIDSPSVDSILSKGVWSHVWQGGIHGIGTLLYMGKVKSGNLEWAKEYFLGPLRAW